VRALALAVLVACDGGSSIEPDGAIRNDSYDGPPGCVTPALQQPWLALSLSHWVLGLTAGPRSTVTERDTARAFLAQELTMMGWTPQTHQYNSGANVYAVIPATMGFEKQIVVGAHFDTVPN
jgi:hypothetical protein